MSKREFFIIAIITFITIVSWVVADIFHTRAQVGISPKLQQVIEPIEPDFDQEAIKLLP